MVNETCRYNFIYRDIYHNVMRMKNYKHPECPKIEICVKYGIYL